MTRWSGIAAALVSCLLLAGCPRGGPAGDGAGLGSGGPAVAGDPQNTGSPLAATGLPRLPPYQGPPGGGPPSAGPLTSVRAALDLAPGTGGAAFSAEAVVAAPGGGAYVSLIPDDRSVAPRLVSVGRAGTALTVLRSVPTPGVGSVWGLYRLPGGLLLIAGRVGDVGPGRGGYGFDVVDPAAGVLREHVVIPFAVGTTFSFGRSAVSADGRTLYLFVSVDLGQVADERLLAVDVTTGAVRTDRPLGADLHPVTLTPIGNSVAGLVARPHGGVTLVFDALPKSSPLQQIPTLLTYDAQLHPVGSAVRVLSVPDGARTRAVSAAADGTVFLGVQVAQEVWVLAVPDRGGAGPVLVQLTKSRYDEALVVEPAQVWGLMPAAKGARAIDLTNGAVEPSVDFGCAWQDVAAMAPGNDGGALLVGVCDSARTRTQMLWVLSP